MRDYNTIIESGEVASKNHPTAQRPTGYPGMAQAKPLVIVVNVQEKLGLLICINNVDYIVVMVEVKNLMLNDSPSRSNSGRSGSSRTRK
ncbi:hypothetical protein DDB_G0268912 [Dictyostelium discoideum AX4]|uniref:Uncharacterized protein n=1 Tax=Dictyostelium discoideum TaxID=44689 RepID=Q55EG4_DICDI|nr:hypothetical protein DDB_G0268912 [Dictyostelium discoideum AX4]EAL73045.1 hypothetical protein DDB_G0268912 [Dictyostelium discoideum AX4]|eukprot:XP_647056.1 hypothetical protein DDB_G0268912 [Dictyostelium discoideum AX4]